MKIQSVLRNFLIAIVALVAIDYAVGCIATYGIKKFYGLNQHAKILLNGHSHLMLAVDKERMESELGMPISKFCREGADVYDRYIMSRMYLDTEYADSLEYVMYGVDLYTFTGGGLSANSYKLFNPFMDSKIVADFVKEHAEPLDYHMNKFIHTYRFNGDVTKNAAIRGLLKDWSNKKTGVIDIKTYRKKLANGDERHILMNPELIAKFKETIKLYTDRGIKVILVHTPTLDLLNEYEPKEFSEICQWYEDYAASEPLVDYWDFNPDYAYRHELFVDRLHINADGQYIVSAAITNKFKQEIK